MYFGSSEKSKMDLHGDVKKATSLSLTDNVKFFHLKGLSQAEKDRKMNERKVKSPRNLIVRMLYI